MREILRIIWEAIGCWHLAVPRQELSLFLCLTGRFTLQPRQDWETFYRIVEFQMWLQPWGQVRIPNTTITATTTITAAITNRDDKLRPTLIPRITSRRLSRWSLRWNYCYFINYSTIRNNITSTSNTTVSWNRDWRNCRNYNCSGCGGVEYCWMCDRVLWDL